MLNSAAAYDCFYARLSTDYLIDSAPLASTLYSCEAYLETELGSFALFSYLFIVLGDYCCSF